MNPDIIGSTTITVVLLVASVVSQVAPEGQRQPSLLRAQQAEVDRLFDEAASLEDQERLPEAILLIEHALGIEIELYGPEAWKVAGSYAYLSPIYEEVGEVEIARDYLVQVVEIAVSGGSRANLDKANGLLRAFDARQLWTEEQRGLMLEAGELKTRIRELYDLGRYEDAVGLAKRQLDLRQRVQGEEDAEYATNLHDIGLLLDQADQSEAALEYWVQALDVRTRVLGPYHPKTLDSVFNLGSWMAGSREAELAVPALQDAYEGYAAVLGEEHPLARDASMRIMATRLIGGLQTPWKSQRGSATAEALMGNGMGLAGWFRALGSYSLAKEDLGRAEECFAEAVRRSEAELGPSDVGYAESLHRLARLYMRRGDYVRVQPLLTEAHAILDRSEEAAPGSLASVFLDRALTDRAMGDQAGASRALQLALGHAQDGVSAQNSQQLSLQEQLASLAIEMGQLEEGRDVLTQVVAATAGRAGVFSSIRRRALTSLAEVHSLLGHHEIASETIDSAIEESGESDGLPSLEVSHLLHGRAVIAMRRGDLEGALVDLQHALEALERLPDVESLQLSRVLRTLGVLHLRSGKPDRARLSLERSLDTVWEAKERFSTIQSRRQQLALSTALRGSLDDWLALAMSQELPAKDIWLRVLQWKGAILDRQRFMRIARTDLGLSPLFEELRRTSADLADGVLAVQSGRATDLELQALSDRREQIERSIARESEEFLAVRCDLSLGPDRIRRRLGSDEVLIDCLEYSRTIPSSLAINDDANPGVQLQLLAIVARRNDQPVAVELGSSLIIEEAIHEWRMAVIASDSSSTRSAGMRLRQLVWEPLSKHFGGAGVVVLSPDGPLSLLPLGALPGESGSGFLIQQMAISRIPSPLLLFEPGRRVLAAECSALLVGDVAFGADLGQSLSLLRSASWREFPPLPGSARELEAIAAVHGTAFGLEGDGVTLLLRDHATEAAFRREAPRHRFLHLATHGFFSPIATIEERLDQDGWVGGAPPVDLRTQLIAWHPDLLSGFPLAGANLGSGGGSDDGLVTALEVEALDLSGTDLFVLSACDTGLGRRAAGEGLLGLVRAGHVAGARTVVGSLWKVPDQATRTVMSSFYSNLWELGMSKREALRDAQIQAIEQRAEVLDWGAWVLSGDGS